jgi:hypothetical protein
LDLRPWAQRSQLLKIGLRHERRPAANVDWPCRSSPLHSFRRDRGVAPTKAKVDGVKPKAEFLITADWPVALDSNVDLWLGRAGEEARLLWVARPRLRIARSRQSWLFDLADHARRPIYGDDPAHYPDIRLQGCIARSASYRRRDNAAARLKFIAIGAQARSIPIRGERRPARRSPERTRKPREAQRRRRQ